VRQAVDSGDVEHISVFAIAPIPPLVYLGWCLDDKTPTRLFQNHRDQFVGWSWADQNDPAEFEVSVTDGDGGPKDVVLVCAVTSEVNASLLPGNLADAPRIEVRPVDASPDPTVMSHEQSLANFAITWRAGWTTCGS
jgi:hypothetical protein